MSGHELGHQKRSPDKLKPMNRPLSIALLPGWGTNPAIFATLQEDLSTRGHQVSIYEMPGYHSRQAEPDSTTLEQLCDDAIEQLGNASLWIGWSLGAMVALAVAAKRPAFLKGVIAVCATTTFCSNDAKRTALDELRRSVTENSTKALHRFQRSMPASNHRRAIAKSLPKSSDQVFTSTETLLNGLDLLQRADLSQQVNKIVVPVRLVSGDEDPIIDSAAGQAIADMIPGSQFATLPCGHLPFLECRDLFMEHVFEFSETIS